MQLDFSEIQDWQQFEDLALAYFEVVKNEDNHISDVFVEPSGEGGDGGRDILITLTVNDSLITYKRKWVVQCKFYENSINKGNLADINIPTLIHEYGADGYLLICKNGVTAPLTAQFESLRDNCRFNYNYLMWFGTQFKKRLLTHPEILQQFFPNYYAFTQQQMNRIDL